MLFIEGVSHEKIEQYNFYFVRSVLVVFIVIQNARFSRCWGRGVLVRCLIIDILLLIS